MPRTSAEELLLTSTLQQHPYAFKQCDESSEYRRSSRFSDAVSASIRGFFSSLLQ